MARTRNITYTRCIRCVNNSLCASLGKRLPDLYDCKKFIEVRDGADKKPHNI